MEELAKLGLEVDASGFIRAKKTLDEFSGSAAKAESRSERFGKAAAKAGREAGKGLAIAGAALTAITANSIRLATTFESSLTQINTLVGVSRDQIDQYREGILSLAPAVGRGPDELARAMFAITSAGARGSEAMDILEASSRAAAIGLGDTRDIALAAGAAVTAYGSETLSAAQAVEIMVGTIEQGNLEASQLAGVLGRVLGLAAQAGVSFQDAGAFIAAFTRQGVDAAQAVTGLRGALTILVREPTAQAVEAFERMGMTVEGFRRQVRDEGFIEAFQQLADRAAEAGIEMGQIIPEVEALSGVMAVFASRGEKASSIADSVGRAVGTMGDRFDEAVKNDPALAFAMINAEFQTMQTRLGVELLPALMTLVQTLRSAEDGAGPLRDALIGVARVILTLAEYGTLASGMFVELGLRMGQVLAIGEKIGQVSGEEFGLSSLLVPFKAIVDTVQTVNRVMDESGEINQAVRDDIRETREVYQQLAASFAESAKELGKLSSGQKEQAQGLGVIASALQFAGDAYARAGQLSRALNESLSETPAAAVKTAEELREAAAASQRWADRLADLHSELSGAIPSALRTYQSAVQEIALAHQAGEMDYQTTIALLDAEARAFQRTAAAIRDDYIAAIREISGLDVTNLFGQMFGGGESSGGNPFAAALSQIGEGFAQSVFNGQDIARSLSSAFTGTGGRILGRAADTFFADATEHGLTKAFQNSRTQEGMAGGFALAIGQALEGNYVQAGFTAAGTAIAGPIGGMIGSMIGGIVEGLLKSKPKFQIRGEFSSIAIDEGTDRLIETALGTVEFAFRGIEGGIKSQVIAAITEVDSNVAAFVRDELLLDSIERALEEWGASSRAFGDDFEAMVRDRLRAIADTFPEIIADFVNGAQTAEGMLENLYSAMAINRALIRGISLGLAMPESGALPGPALPGPSLPPPGINPPVSPPIDPGIDPPQIPRVEQSAGAFMAILNEVGEGFDAAIVATEGLHPQLAQTVEALLEVRIGTEPLIDTFNRMVRVLDTLDGAAALMGARFGETREDMIRFGADLVALFGDDAESLAASLDRIFGAIYTDAERAEAEAARASQRAGELLAGLFAGIDGMDFDESMLTLDGFREAFESLMQSGALTPEQVAVLIEAGNAIVSLSEAQGRLVDEIVESARDAEGIAEILAGMKTDAARSGLEGVALALFDLDQSTAETRAELERMGATAGELSVFERLAADERLRVVEDFARQAVEAERQRLSDLASLRANVRSELTLGGLSDFSREAVSIQTAGLQMAEALNEAAIAAGFEAAAASDLAAVHELVAQRMAALVGRMKEAARSLVEQLFGTELSRLDDEIRALQGGAASAGDGLGALGNTLSDVADATQRATDDLRRFADSLLIGNLSPLNSGDRLDEAFLQLQDASARGDASGVQSLANSVLQIGRERFASGQEFNELFAEVQRIIRGTTPASERPQPVTIVGGAVAASPELEALLARQAELQAEQQAQQDAVLGRQLAQIIADLSGATGDSFDSIADELGFDLAQLGDVLGLDQSGLKSLIAGMVDDSTATANQLFSLERTLFNELVIQTAKLNEIAESVRPIEFGKDRLTSKLIPAEEAGRLERADTEVAAAVTGTTKAVDEAGDQITRAIQSSGEETVALLRRIANELERTSGTRGNTKVAV